MGDVERYISVKPSERQVEHAKNPFYVFIHFGMNTMTQREWGTGYESEKDFCLKEKVDSDGWAKAVKKAGASGIILTCKHHDGFCLFPSKYTEHSIKNSPYMDGKGDIVKDVSESCKKYGLKFGVYLSPWDIADERYGTDAYNDYFCNQLTELLTDYGDIFEVWFDGAKGKDAVDFEYDWERYYKLIRELQPMANIAVCGPDIRWVGNEGGKTRKSEFSVVPAYLCDTEKVAESSQNDAGQTGKMKKLTAESEDLGSREVLEKSDKLIWYPAEVDVSISKTWFYNKNTDRTLKSVNKLMKIYNTSVGSNCYLLLNVPPNSEGKFSEKEIKLLEKFGNKIKEQTKKQVIKKKNPKFKDNEFIADFKQRRKFRTVVLKENILNSQRVESFELYAVNGKRERKIYSSTIIGMNKICRLKIPCKAEALKVKITSCRSNPCISLLSVFE